MAVIEHSGRLEDHYTMIPNDLARSSEITPRAAKVYIFLASHNTGWRVTTERVANEIGLSHKTVKYAIQDLEALGWITRSQTRSESGDFSEMKYQVNTVVQNMPHGSETMGENGAVPFRAVPIGADPFSTPHKKTIPKKTNTKKTNTKKIDARACALSPDWTISDEDVQRLKKKYPGVDIRLEEEKFRDYWLERGTKRKSWMLTFHNWLSRAKPTETPEWRKLDSWEIGSKEEAPF